MFPWLASGLRLNGGQRREFIRGEARPFLPLDGRRGAPDRQWLKSRSPDGAGAKRLRHLVIERNFFRLFHSPPKEFWLSH